MYKLRGQEELAKIIHYKELISEPGMDRITNEFLQADRKGAGKI
jgi:hypothetical protein